MNFHSFSGRLGASLHARPLLRPLAVSMVLAFSGSAALAEPVTHVVTTCDDPLPVPLTCAESTDGTLRQGFLCAQNGDTIDLTQLVCSTITLSAPLVAGPGTLTLSGPGAGQADDRRGGPVSGSGSQRGPRRRLVRQRSDHCATAITTIHPPAAAAAASVLRAKSSSTTALCPHATYRARHTPTAEGSLPS